MRLCRYMLYDRFGSTDVRLDIGNQQVRLELTADNSTSLVTCVDNFNATTGGSCTMEVPAALFNTSTIISGLAELQLLSEGAVISSAQSTVMLTGKPAQSSVSPRTGFGFGPYRNLFPGETILFPVFAHTNGERAREFLLHATYNNSVLEPIDDFDLGPGWRVCLFHTVLCLQVARDFRAPDCPLSMC